MNKVELEKLTNDIIETLLKKNSDYGGASFDLGLNGNMIHLWDKVSRYRSLIEKKNKGEAPNFESIEDTLKDIVGYALIGLLIFPHEKNQEGEKNNDQC